jgi:zinc transport system ATP-binding protein
MHSQSKTLISLQNVDFRYDRRVVLERTNLDIKAGDFLAITGPNGGGKTTLLRLILRLMKPTHGSVTYCSDSLRIGYLPQKNLIDSRFPITVREVISLGLLARRDLHPQQRSKMVEETIAQMGLSEYAENAIGNLSGGQLQRALIGRAIISQPDLLVLDEPLSYLDKHYEQRLYEIMEEIGKRSTIVLVSHEMSTIAGMANRHIIIDRTIHECKAAHHFVITECDE